MCVCVFRCVCACIGDAGAAAHVASAPFIPPQFSAVSRSHILSPVSHLELE